MKIEIGALIIEMTKKAIASVFGLYLAWMVWVTTSLYGQRQDIALIKQMVEKRDVNLSSN